MSGRPMKEILSGMNGIVEKKKIANNTVWYKMANGEERIRLYGTDIATLFGQKIVLNSGGWRTRTTRDRLDEALRRFCVPGCAPRGYQNKGITYVGSEVFYDGMVVKRDGTIQKNKRRAAAEIARTFRLKKLIDRYCKKLASLEQFPAPNAGDCLICRFGSDTCLESHLKEQYIHGSLIMRVLQDMNCGSAWYEGLFEKMEPRKGDWRRTSVVRFVRRYFKKHLGLA